MGITEAFDPAAQHAGRHWHDVMLAVEGPCALDWRALFAHGWQHWYEEALQRAAHRGVDVRLLLTGPQTDHPAAWHAGRRFYGRLLQAGVRIFEFQPRFLHAKLVLCDDWSSIGGAQCEQAS